MKYARHCVSELLIAGLLGSNLGCAYSGADSGGAVVEVESEQAFGISWEDYRARAIPTEGGGVIAERDLQFADEAELRIHYDRMVEEKEKLVVFRQTSTGYEPTFTDAEQLELKYCVANTFANKSTVVSHMAAATKAWEEVARLRFTYVSAQDASCTASNANVTFAVMPTTVSGLLGCACSKKMWDGLLPIGGCQTSSSSARFKGVLVLNYGATLNPGETRTGVVRHELGHMLGFRHEHPWDPSPACTEAQSYDSPYDVTGRQLTPYDKTSVMHYQSCDGIAGADNIISPLDGEGARSIYGMPVSWYQAFTAR